MRFLSVIAFALLATGALAQVPLVYPDFPFCQCTESPSPYSVASVAFKGNRTYCFTVAVNTAGCPTTNKCCRADVKKLEINAKSACDIAGLQLSATVKGAASSVRPNIEIAPQGPSGATILKLTQLGLDLTNANGAEICITLGTTRAGLGCDTLEELCVPPAGQPAGTCSTALFSTDNDCCPQDVVPNPPTPATRPCDTCVAFTLQSPPSVVPYNFTAEQCDAYATAVAYGIAEKADEVNAVITKGFTLASCGGRSVQVCGSFANSSEGLKVKPYGNDLARDFLNLVTAGETTYLTGHTVTVGIRGTDGPAGHRRLLQTVENCIEGNAAITLTPGTVDFPKCECDIAPGSTIWAPQPFYTTKAGRNSNLYCFSFTTVTPVANPNNTCASAESFHKVEFWANETMRRSIIGFQVKPNGAANYTYISASWGAKGEDTVKATPLNWSKAQANGGEICLELAKTTTLSDFCLGPYPNGCYLNIFDISRKCCPLYAPVDAPEVPVP